MEVKSAVFKMSVSGLKECPKPVYPEYAFIGRSNVGKSSLINMLCGKKEMARTSSTPGKTVSMNYFMINDNWYLVDLPGYGFAKRSKTLRHEWSHSLSEYIKKRENLACVFVLVDSRIPPQLNDLSFVNFLGENQIPFSIIFTKLDKLKPQEAEANIEAFCEEMSKDWAHLPDMFRTSALDKTGRKEVLNAIGAINDSFWQSRK
ncbi:MAG: ribosome biogenesis GTP-binding protein YihA/YsxC [Bacteroidia bacterium]|nr:ribosome biogenesis GTP-binding protein YihA/YsxC [Bacteroidia bacterium]